MPKPRSLTDLPYARFLAAADGPPVRSGDYETVHFADLDLTGVQADGARFLESAFSSVDLTDARLRNALFNEVWMQSGRLVGTNLAESRWLDSEVCVASLAGTALYGAELTRVAFFGCKLVAVNLREARLRDVVFADCSLDGVDLTGATLTNVSFPGSTLHDVALDRTTMRHVDLRQARDLSFQAGRDSLAGLTVNPHQLLGLAPAFAQILGVTVAD
ncbi:pentapeptide repeat protein [Actinocorallia herbida]|uniref:Pentapeptide repeat protein n=1 Tax=Actinocorallia herbida TaxID=58109 RepID=A0A3N1CZI2_9ACTN|nr:pentapeptide repeat-containing protein [Actinocorallia herbida]ROO86677.1 pentapeptide repeat protein [Actinocorallia herbida]